MTKPKAQLVGFYGAGPLFEEIRRNYTPPDEDWYARRPRRGNPARCQIEQHSEDDA